MQMSNLKIRPRSDVVGHRTGYIQGLSKADIDRILGFRPNVDDDADKVRYSWGFTADGECCAVWDWKGSYRSQVWSTHGAEALLQSLFGEHYHHEG